MRKDNIIYTKEFKNWFGDWENDPEHSSKVMSRGKPLAVYHGSLKLFKRFDVGKGYNVPAIWHSSNPEAASHWSGTSTVHRGEDLTVEFRNLKKQVFLLQQDEASTGKIVKVLDSFARKNLDTRVKVQETYRSREDCLKSGMDPKVFEGTTYQVDLAHRNGGETSFVVHNDTRELYTRILDYLDTEVVDATSHVKRPGEGYLYKNYLNIRNPLTVDAKGHVYYDIPFQGKRHSTESLALYAMDHGYDGVIVMNVYETDYEDVKGNDYIVFHSNQVKSATDNNGNFSPESDNIYESLENNRTEKEDNSIYTKEFKAWFGDWEHNLEHSSKAVDREGKPLVLYHGSSQDFDTFDPTLGREASDIQGIYLTPDAEEAGNYGDKVRAFYVNMRNPADSSTAYKVWKRYRSQGDAKAGVKAREELQSMGYDGVIWEDELYPEYVVFSANQVKSVDSKGFSSSSDNIYESRDLLDMDTEEVLDLAGRPAIYSEAFKKWFGDWENDPEHSSKMVGMNGRPKVFYHGTDREFDAFSTDAIGRSTGELGWYGKGFYFTPDYLQARHYGSKVLEVYLNIRHPFYMDSDNLRKYKGELGLTDKDLDGTDPARFLKDNRRSLRISNLLVKEGYDGIVYSEDGVSFSEVIAFNPNQIKSVDSKGFDRESDNIYEGREDSITDTLEFRRWFGDWKNDPEHASKMVDKEGRPFVCYHGSHEEFSEFQDKYHWNDSGYFGKGFYFTFSDDREASKAEAKFYGPIIYECYLNIRNPFDFSQLYYKDGEKGDVDLALYNLYRTSPELDSYIRIDCDGREIGLKEYGRLYEETESRMYIDQMVDGDYVWRLRRDNLKEDEEDYYGWTQYHTKEEAEKEKLTWLKTFLIQYENVYLYQFPYYILQASDMFSELVRKKGHDGIVQSMRGDEAVVFRPEQIKSVDNSGEFSPQSRNIYERIVRRDGKWMVTDHTGKMNLGTYDTKEEAEERLRQVEIFKHMSERFVSGIADLL